MEEEEGFEPPRALTPLSVFKADPFNQTWVFLRILWWTLQDSKLRPIGYEPIALPSRSTGPWYSTALTRPVGIERAKPCAASPRMTCVAAIAVAQTRHYTRVGGSNRRP